MSSKSRGLQSISTVTFIFLYISLFQDARTEIFKDDLPHKGKSAQRREVEDGEAS